MAKREYKSYELTNGCMAAPQFGGEAVAIIKIGPEEPHEILCYIHADVIKLISKQLEKMEGGE